MRNENNTYCDVVLKYIVILRAFSLKVKLRIMIETATNKCPKN